MRIYSTGMLGFLATVTSLIANVGIYQKFNSDYPLIFWGAQLLLGAVFITIAMYAIVERDNDQPYSKFSLYRSIVVCVLMYCIAYTGSKYAFALIFTVGLVEIYLTRKRSGLVKSKK